MHPGFFRWWKEMQHLHNSARCGPRSEWTGSGFFENKLGSPPSGGPGFGGAGFGFGVRRPLRFLIHKLDLDERQSAELAIIIDTLKTERAQAAVDNRRTVSAMAELLGGEAFDEHAAAETASARAKSAERLSQAVIAALQKLHALLNEEQREKLAYLIRSGSLSL